MGRRLHRESLREIGEIDVWRGRHQGDRETRVHACDAAEARRRVRVRQRLRGVSAREQQLQPPSQHLEANKRQIGGGRELGFETKGSPG